MAASVKNEFVIGVSPVATNRHSKTLVLMFGYYGATDRALQKYSSIYQGYGFDVLPIKSYLKQIAMPTVSKALVTRILRYLRDNCMEYDHFLVHAFSFGIYNFQVCLMMMRDNPKLHGDIKHKICGTIYDSVTIGQVKGFARGMATGTSENKAVRWLLIKVMLAYLKVTQRHVVAAFEKASNSFRNPPPLQVPTLLFYSKNDLMTKYGVIDDLIDRWRARFSFPIEGKLWSESLHAAHLLAHTEDYLHALNGFIESLPYLARRTNYEIIDRISQLGHVNVPSATLKGVA